MTENFKILGEFVKDISGETKDIETYLFVKEHLSKYHLLINIASEPLKNNMIEVSTTIKYHDKDKNEKQSYFEIIYATVIKLTKEIKNKKDLEKILLCDVQNTIYPRLEKVLLNLISNSGYPGVKFEKKIDFDKLYKEQFN